MMTLQHILLFPFAAVLLLALTKGTSEMESTSMPAQPGAFSLNRLAPTDSLWVEETLQSMTVAEKVGQLFVVPFTGAFVNKSNDYFQELKRQIQKNHVGGFRMYGGQPVEAAYLINNMQRLANVPLIIASNFERGNDQPLRDYATVRLDGDRYTRVRPAIELPTNMALGATDSEAYAFFQGAVSAREARAMGIHWIFAPVVDVNNNPANPIINVRSYGEDPTRVAALAAAFIQGAQANGVMATAKHFPGHGDTQVDSHTDLPTVEIGWERFTEVELVPFERAIESGVGAVMTSHIVFPKIDPSGVPATLSPFLLTDILRDSLGFQGLVITDAMTMDAITERFGPGQAIVAAINAGADCILTPPDNDTAIRAALEAVQNGTISKERLEVSVRKILTAKAALGLHRQRLVELAALDSLLADEDYLKTAQEIADAAVTLLKNSEQILPLSKAPANQRILSVTVNGDDAANVDAIYRHAVRQRLPNAEFTEVDRFTPKSIWQDLLSQASQADIIFCPIFANVRAYKGRVGLGTKLNEFVHQFLKLQKPTILVSLGNPYLIQEFPESSTYLTTFGHSYPLQVAAVRAVFGEIDLRGRLPISIPDDFAIGDGLDVPSTRAKKPLTVVFQPSHQTDTGRDFNEALTCNAIVEAALKVSTGGLDVHKVWSYNESGLHHAQEGSNTKIAHTSALEDGKISGYAFELNKANALNADIFISVHNNGGTRRHACWGFVHEGDPYEWMNRVLAQSLVDAICKATGLENRGVLGDSAPGRNDYRCISTGKRAFYSLDEHVNETPLRVLLEVGDNAASRAFLTNPDSLRIVGETIQKVLEQQFGIRR